jgi:putative peptidoglycan lipid II flippase
MVANMIMNLVFVAALVLTIGAGHVGLALATSLGACLNAGLLWRGLYRDGTYRFDAAWRVYLTRLVLACGAIAVVLVLLNPATATWFALDAPGRVLRIGGLCIVGLLAFVATLVATGMRPSDLRAPRSGESTESA